MLVMMNRQEADMPTIGVNDNASASVPPEVPPFHPPSWPPRQPPVPTPTPAPNPVPVMPTWYEPDPDWRGRELEDRLLDKRVVMAGGVLDDALANRVAAQLMLVDRRTSKPIQLHLACSQSELDASLALADAVELLSAPVHATVRGTLGGPAVAVLCAAAQRSAHRHSMIVLMRPVGTADGTARGVGLLAEQFERKVARLHEAVAAVSGRDVAEVADDFDRGRVLLAEDALSYGLVERLL
jgi:ATP-dependent Clp protease, protease subunit